MKTIIKTITLCITILFFFSCSGKKSVEVTVEKKEKIKVAEVRQQKIDQLFEYTAIIEADVTNNVAPSVPGRISKIYVEVGDRVSVGQKLISMDETNLLQLESQYKNVEANFKRIDELYKAGGVSKAEWDVQKTQLDVLKTQYDNLVLNTYLKSPISGYITMRNFDDGDLYSGNSVQMPVLQVQKITPVKLLVNVSEHQYTSIKTNLKVSVHVDALNKDFEGRVSLIYPTIDKATHTFPVEITVPNSNGVIRPGMYSKVTISMGTLDHVVVPDVAVIKQQGSGDRYVYVYKDGKVSYNKVELGRRLGDAYELFTGVNDGDKVVVSGISKLKNGKEVEVVE